MNEYPSTLVEKLKRRNTSVVVVGVGNGTWIQHFGKWGRSADHYKARSSDWPQR